MWHYFLTVNWGLQLGHDKVLPGFMDTVVMISPMSTGHTTNEAEKMMIGLFIYLTPGGHQFKMFLMCNLLRFSLIREQRGEYVYIILLHLHLHLLFHCCYQWLIHSYVAQLTIVNFSYVHAGEQDSCYMQTLHTITQLICQSQCYLLQQIPLPAYLLLHV